MRAVVCRVGLIFEKEMKKESCIVKHDSICFSLEMWDENPCFM